MTAPLLSILIGYRDWDLDRLDAALACHRASSLGAELEIVIADLGSRDAGAVEEVTRRHGGRFVSAPEDVWSRARAMNVAIAHATAEHLITTDADILFAPRTHEIVLSRLRRYADAVQLVQCLDLPEGASALAPDWDAFAAKAILRSRGAMGGLAAFSKAVAARVRGFDERMQVWGSEDSDFVLRARGAGSASHWIVHPDARIFHRWHASFATRGPESASTVALNRALAADPSVVRNLHPGARFRQATPTVSIVIASRDRNALLLRAIESCLQQSFTDFEIVVVDDASGDGTADAIATLGDPRVRCHRLTDRAGLAHARTLGTTLARGKYVAVQEDDGLMLPRRLEIQLRALTDGASGSVGGWYRFDESTGDVSAHGGEAGPSLDAWMRRSLALQHGTLLVRRTLLARHSYEDAGGDGLIRRLLRDGTHLVHCGEPVVLSPVPRDAWMRPPLSAAQKLSRTMTAAVMPVSAVAQPSGKRAAQARPAPLDETQAWLEALELLPDALTLKVQRASANPALIAQLVRAGIPFLLRFIRTENAVRMPWVWLSREHRHAFPHELAKDPATLRPTHRLRDGGEPPSVLCLTAVRELRQRIVGMIRCCGDLLEVLEQGLMHWPPGSTGFVEWQSPDAIAILFPLEAADGELDPALLPLVLRDAKASVLVAPDAA